MKGERNLIHMVSFYDHATRTVPRPRILMDKKTGDAHDNPCLAIDGKGHLWVFSNAHGTARPAWITRSRAPYSIDSFEEILKTNFSYGQPWHFKGRGFLLLHTKYGNRGRSLFWMTSPDGRTWTKRRLLARIARGHYQVSDRSGEKVGTAFNYHPDPKGLNWRTNLYYLETPDLGRTWRTADGTTIEPPLREIRNPALIRDFESEGLRVYMKDLNFDEKGRPVILFLTSKGWQPGPQNGPRTWRVAAWTGSAWEIHDVTRSDHNYDFGSIYVEADGTWRIIGPSEPGPQKYMTGGEVAMWTSRDRGRIWKKTAQLTSGSPRNHSYVRRPVNAHPDFYAFWADGNSSAPSVSELYFATRDGRVFRLPPEMSSGTAKPEEVTR